MTLLLIQACLPLAALVALGYAIGRLHKVDLKSVATLVIYAITPLVAFGSAARLNFTPSLLALPICTFAIASLIGMGIYAVGGCLHDKAKRSLLPVACGSGNTGYFGLPIAMALFGQETAGIYFLANLGVVVFETSLGFYFVARSTLSGKEALRRVVRLPILYALSAGLALAALHISLPDAIVKLCNLGKGAYVVVGMMIAGLALAQAKGFSLSPRLVGLVFLGKFVFWPAAAFLFTWIDPGILNSQEHHLVQVMSLVPVAANLPAYAAANNVPVRDAALLVLMSTILAIGFLPLVLPALL